MPPSTPSSGPLARFTSAYQRVVDHWPVKVTGLDAPTDYGTTHLLASGDETAPVVLLLPGGSATATALHAPARVSHLVLLDPTTCLAPLGLAYRLRSIPLFTRPSAARARRLLAWETRGRPLDPDWLAVAAAGADLGRPQIVLPAVLKPAELASLVMPVLVVIAARSRAHDPAQIAVRARQRLPQVTVETLAQASHHTIPTEDARELTAYIARFLASGYAR